MEAEAEAEVVLSGLEAAVTWRDEASACEDMGRRCDVRNVWARVGDVKNHSTVDPTLLDSLAEDLVVPPLTNLEDIGRRGSDAVDDCSSVSSESCWGEMEGIGDDEPVLWGVLPDPPSGQTDISLEGNRVRPRARRLQLVSSQTVVPSTWNKFAALDEDVDVPHPPESGSLYAGGADVVHIGTPRVQSSSEVRRVEHENEALDTPIDEPVSDSSDTESVGSGSSCSAQPDGGEVAPTLPIDEVSISVEFVTSLSQLDTLDLEEVFHHRALLMKSPPAFKKEKRCVQVCDEVGIGRIGLGKGQ